MSTILKALRRLEEEKSAGASRPLREEVATPPFVAGPPPRRGLPVVGLSIAFAVLLGLGAWWLRPPQAEDERAVADASAESRTLAQAETAPAPLAESARPARAAPSAAEPVEDPASAAGEGPPAQAFSSPVEVVPRPPVTPRVPIELSPRAARAEVAEAPARESATPSTVAAPTPSVVAAAPAPKPRSASRPAAETKPLVRRRPPVPEVAAAPAPVEPAPALAPAPAKRPAQVAVAPKPAPEPAPVERPAPAPVRKVAVESTAPPVAAAPRLRVDKTLWHPQPDRREAVVGLDGAKARRVHEGDVVGRFVVSEIQPSGVVFEGDGTTLRRGIGTE